MSGQVLALSAVLVDRGVVRYLHLVQYWVTEVAEEWSGTSLSAVLGD